jgi:hypothetical protein
MSSLRSETQDSIRMIKKGTKSIDIIRETKKLIKDMD